MCGIAGFALKGGFEADSAEREARAMADAIIHRGPDGSGHGLMRRQGSRCLTGDYPSDYPQQALSRCILIPIGM